MDRATKQRRGSFVVIEGIDGSGKSTLIRGLQHRLAAERQAGRVAFFREPTDGPIGREIREHLKRASELDPEQWLDLFFRDRAENLREHVEPALQRGILVIQDRYFFSTAAYQGRTDGITASAIIERSVAAGFPLPELLLFLRIAPGEAMARIRDRSNLTESFESQSQLEAIDSRYRSVLPDNAIVLDATQTPEQVLEDALERIRSLPPAHEKKPGA
ncbi:MAG: dTMP kinase [Spirochaetales bacterium]|nr:dTMP kinase [Leptospiraceae bacterium]MCP5482898.1 dTMP kinase [Spirochaetales bacterium]